MKWVVLHILGNNLLPFGYNNSIKIAYALNITVVTIGIGERLYNLEENSKNFTFEAKMRLLLDFCSEEDHLRYREGIQKMKIYNKIKNKPSQLIVAYNQLKTTLLKIYDEGSDLFFHSLQISHEIGTLKKIIHPDHFYYYPDSVITDKVETGFFKLEFPDPEKGIPLFFLTIQDLDNKELLPYKLFNSSDKAAEELGNAYADASCCFPFLPFSSEKDLRSIRADLEQPSKEFREKIEAWAKVCHQHPNSNEGLLYFRKHLKKWLSTTQKLPLKSNYLKLVNKVNKNLQSQIFIGEMPIQQIWELFYTSDTIEKKFYDSLLQIKSEQSPKYDGRWPVVIYKCIDTDFKFNNPFQDHREEEVQLSVRKTISLD